MQAIRDFRVIDEQRAATVAEARTWLRTPFHDCAGLKGTGTDCAGLPYGVYRAAGLVPEIEIPPYSPQFMMHHHTEIYLGIVLDYAVEISSVPEPGDFVLWRFGRCFAHGAIVVRWPRIVHAHKPAGCVIEDDAERNALLARDKSGRLRPRKAFTLKAWVEAVAISRADG